MIVLSVLFWISVFVMFFSMVGYPAVLFLLEKILKPAANKRDDAYCPEVTYMIVAHNEEKVIGKKLENTLTLDYPRDKLHILVASDNSTDATNDIVNAFIQNHPEFRIELYTAKQRKGKTNAQNEAQKVVKSEILVMTDANAMVQPEAIRELVAYFADEDVAYVSGRLMYTDAEEGGTGDSESTYWKLDLKMRDIESRIQTVTAGNGALYACRNKDYIDFDPIECHDSAMPLAYGLMGKRCLYNPDAIAVEKAGDSNQDEFKRKVRMSRDILNAPGDFLRTCNIFKYKWFSFFYFGHRSCRNHLWLAHILALLTNVLLVLFTWNPFWIVMGILQAAAYLLAAAGIVFKIAFAPVRMLSYYVMTVFAQLVGVRNILTGRAKPFWEVVESTRDTH